MKDPPECHHTVRSGGSSVHLSLVQHGPERVGVVVVIAIAAAAIIAGVT